VLDPSTPSRRRPTAGVGQPSGVERAFDFSLSSSSSSSCLSQTPEPKASQLDSLFFARFVFFVPFVFTVSACSAAIAVVRILRCYW
jgi:hypothetical protein